MLPAGELFFRLNDILVWCFYGDGFLCPLCFLKRLIFLTKCFRKLFRDEYKKSKRREVNDKWIRK